MSRDREFPTGRVPPPSRRSSLRRQRQLSNWTAAALIVGTGSATWALAHGIPAPAQAGGMTTTWAPNGTAVSAQGTGPRVSGAVAVTSGSGAVAAASPAAGTTGRGQGPAVAGSGPQVSAPVAVTSGSTVTTTQVVNGKTVTTVQHIAKRDD